jgi:hypothetical protein
MEMIKYYVYKHVDKEEVVYIGMGKIGRAWSYNKRNPEHKKWMETCDTFKDVQPIEKGLTQQEARELEQTLIYELQPKFNVGLKGGSRSHNAKLDYNEVLHIRNNLYPSGMTQKQIADMYKTSQGYISNVITGRLWRHV